MSAHHVIPDEIYHLLIFALFGICNCTNCSAIMVAMLDFTGESALSISVDILAAILDNGTGLQHQLQEWFCSP